MKTRAELKAEYPRFPDEWWDALDRCIAADRERCRPHNGIETPQRSRRRALVDGL